MNEKKVELSIEEAEALVRLFKSLTMYCASNGMPQLVKDGVGLVDEFQKRVDKAKQAVNWGIVGKLVFYACNLYCTIVTIEHVLHCK